jgi:hypothetical protein
MLFFNTITKSIEVGVAAKFSVPCFVWHYSVFRKDGWVGMDEGVVIPQDAVVGLGGNLA